MAAAIFEARQSRRVRGYRLLVCDDVEFACLRLLLGEQGHIDLVFRWNRAKAFAVDCLAKCELQSFIAGKDIPQKFSLLPRVVHEVTGNDEEDRKQRFENAQEVRSWSVRARDEGIVFEISVPQGNVGFVLKEYNARLMGRNLEGMCQMREDLPLDEFRARAVRSVAEMKILKGIASDFARLRRENRTGELAVRKRR